MELLEVLEVMKAAADSEAVEGMARFGISSENTLGLSIPFLRKLAKRIGVDHDLAMGLWSTGIHEARILAGFVDDPEKVTPAQMDAWASDFDSWDVCDQCCSSLFDRTPYAYGKVVEWSGRKEEFVKRAAFALMAALAVHDKEAKDDDFLAFLPYIEREADDERNYVKKAVNWALRQIGKRNRRLNKKAREVAEAIHRRGTKAAKWIASDALRELGSPAVQKRLQAKD